MEGVDIAGLLDFARSAQGVRGFEAQALGELSRAIPCDVAAYLRPEGPGMALGLRREEDWRAKVAVRNAAYESELEPFVRATFARGVGVDTDFYDRCTFKRTLYYREILEPESGHSTLFGILQFAGGHVGTIALGRRRGSFHSSEVARLHSALPALSTCEMAMRASPVRPIASSIAHAVTRRERQILDCLRLGYDNRQIALVLGTSPNTVRNQLSGIYAKLGVCSRTEALARVFSMGLLDSDCDPV